ncbi:hypothetical protein [Gaiella occulta]|nr:hypothetical protein [Gaiella occulta]
MTGRVAFLLSSPAVSRPYGAAVAGNLDPAREPSSERGIGRPQAAP